MSSINIQMLTQETSIRHLGVYIDYNISWKTHITNISKNIKRSIGILCKLRYFLSTKTLLSLYYALAEPFHSYCIIAWVIPIKQLFNLDLGPIQTYPDIFESATFSFRIQKYPRLHVACSTRISLSTRIRWYPDSP